LSPETVPETPRGKAYSDLIQAGVTTEKVPSIRRKLTNAYALLGEIKTASEQRRGKTKAQLHLHDQRFPFLFLLLVSTPSHAFIFHEIPSITIFPG
jgi:hypothetical protein